MTSLVLYALRQSTLGALLRLSPESSRAGMLAGGAPDVIAKGMKRFAKEAAVQQAACAAIAELVRGLSENQLRLLVDGAVTLSCAGAASAGDQQ
jgi:hypothetical protein